MAIAKYSESHDCELNRAIFMDVFPDWFNACEVVASRLTQLFFGEGLILEESLLDYGASGHYIYAIDKNQNDDIENFPGGCIYIKRVFRKPCCGLYSQCLVG